MARRDYCSACASLRPGARRYGKTCAPSGEGAQGCGPMSLVVVDDCQGVAPKVVVVSSNKVVSEVGGNPMSESSPSPYDQVS